MRRPPLTQRVERTARLPRRALTIAGSDSGGGAGIQADLKTFAAFGVYGLSAITVVTAQDSRAVRRVAAVGATMVAAQLDAVLEDFGADAVKIGMLWDVATARAVAARLAAAVPRGGAPPVVFDPLLAAGTGAALVSGEGGDSGEGDDGGAGGGGGAGGAGGAGGERGGDSGAVFAAIAAAIMPVATLVTPNLPELCRLCGVDDREAAGEAARLALARDLALRGPAVLAKGGHDAATGGEVVDLLVLPGGAGRGGDRVVRFAAPRLAARSLHGTGCTLSAAVAAGLAMGDELATAVGRAIEYVRGAIAAAQPLGAGRMPLEHFWQRNQ